ncbi:MAG: hypothetical protein WHU94_04215 [Thermogemmata sp.]|jgi:hypothetical protein|uniref:Uncharacterized protein n=1 Tax=Thermogemmata fonticola TaxID=2755323 RepID=A0A7V8VE90_9BACT|nr:hypothetical protein [Thermogemmata fonticola]MBA2226346.1 hypothetical protein [Thermogemmata fonticola]MCX8139971.1 hypothetical protein [Gemmataceae bacterium]
MVWFIQRDDIIEFQDNPEGFWAPQVMSQHPLRLEAMRGRPISIRGKGAVWMYAHAGAMAQAAGAASIHLKELIRGNSSDIRQCLCKLEESRQHPGCYLWQMQLNSVQDLKPEAIESLLEPTLKEIREKRPRELCLTGKAPVTVYARVAWEAVAAGCQHLYCLTPIHDCILVYSTSDSQLGERLPLPWLEQFVPQPQKSMILGVIGDPNSGKSVFARALYACLLSRVISQQRRLWILDCDGQSPTPAWYLSLLQEGHVELARQYRDILKERRRWTPTMEDHFVRILQGLRRFFELVITDQPGGDLGADPPQRIPPGRERFFQQLDELILVAREGEVTWKLWHDELARHGLAHRLRVILYGSHPEAPPTLQLTRQGDLWIGTVQGLERTRTKQELVQAFQPVLEPLWEDWRQRLRSCVAEV